MPALQVQEDVVVQIINGTVLANNQPTSFLPGWTIGGSFNTVAKEWIDTFPKDYPYDRTKYDQGKSTYSTLTVDGTTDNWSEFGYSSSTQTTGSNGWIFWSTKSTTTSTSSQTVVHINQTSFKSGISVSAWGIGTFPIQIGQWCMFDLCRFLSCGFLTNPNFI